MEPMNHSNTCRIFHFSIFFSMLWSCAFAEGGPSARVFSVKATQGVAVDLKHFYAISNTKISVHSKENGEQISAWAANRKVAAQAHFQHMNSGTVVEGKLYVTGHDNAEVVVLEMDVAAALRYVRSEPVAGIAGQAIAWDRSAKKPTLWGIIKNKQVSLTIFSR